MTADILTFTKPEPEKKDRTLFCPNCLKRAYRLFEDGHAQCESCGMDHPFVVWYIKIDKD